LDTITRTKIRAILSSCVERTLTRVQSAIANNTTQRPFHTALLTPDIVKVASFERSFSTSFGQGPIESISQLIAQANGYEAARQKESMINVFKGAVDEVERIGDALRARVQQPNWANEVKTVSSFTKGDTVIRRIISDLWLKKDNKEYFLSIKTVKPNIDQTATAKKDMLLLKAADSNYHPFFGLYYNPGGPNREDYNWTVPNVIFDMKNDPCVLIGKDYWEFLGGPGTYEDLLAVFKDAGKETKSTLLHF
jgi:hypothetical protein